jgi:5-methyltetrahydrofolate--homocysteine methyltransferase
MAPAALLDGGMGTALRARGLPAEAFPEEWVLRRPEEVARVHAAHAGAGAGTLLTCTFNAARAEARGLEAEVERICARAVALARGAAREAAEGSLPGRGPPGDPARRLAVPAARVAGCAGGTGLVAPSGEGVEVWPDVRIRSSSA